MPPNAYTLTSLDDHSPAPSSKRRDSHPRPRANNKIIGNYTLAKTLGAGSMGKVKLATHNASGEKVRYSLYLLLLQLIPPSFFCSILARRQDSSPRLPPSAVFTHAHVRLGCKTGCQGYLQRDPYSQRGCSLHVTLPSLHLRHERVDRPPAPLLHGL